MAVVVISLVAVVSIVAQSGTQAAPSGWTIVTGPSTEPPADDILLTTSCPNAFRCFGVGVTIANINSSATFSPLIEQWNGTSWTLATSPAIPGGNGGGLFASSCVDGSDCWAVGAMVGTAGDGSPKGTLTEHWDGMGWSIVPSPTPLGASGALLQGVSCVSSSSCVAVGVTTDQNGENVASLIEHWDGSAWTVQPSAATGQVFDQLDAVHCLGVNDCWAVGNTGPNQQNPDFLPILSGSGERSGIDRALGWECLDHLT